MTTHSSALVWEAKDRGAWQAAVHGVTKSWIQLNTRACTQAHTLSVKLAWRQDCMLQYSNRAVELFVNADTFNKSCFLGFAYVTLRTISCK